MTVPHVLLKMSYCLKHSKPLCSFGYVLLFSFFLFTIKRDAAILLQLYAAYELNRTLIIILTGICFFAGIGGPVMAISFRPKSEAG